MFKGEDNWDDNDAAKQLTNSLFKRDTTKSKLSKAKGQRKRLSDKTLKPGRPVNIQNRPNTNKLQTASNISESTFTKRNKYNDCIPSLSTAQTNTKKRPQEDATGVAPNSKKRKVVNITGTCTPTGKPPSTASSKHNTNQMINDGLAKVCMVTSDAINHGVDDSRRVKKEKKKSNQDHPESHTNHNSQTVSASSKDPTIKNTLFKKNKYSHLAGQKSVIGASNACKVVQDSTVIRNDACDGKAGNATLSNDDLRVTSKSSKLKKKNNRNNILNDAKDHYAGAQTKLIKMRAITAKETESSDLPNKAVKKTDKKHLNSIKIQNILSNSITLSEAHQTVESNTNKAKCNAADEAGSEAKLTGPGEETPLSLGDRMKQKLEAARFRFINEQLYTRNSSEAHELLKDDRPGFEAYHKGFTQQVSKWPENPVQRAIKFIKALNGVKTVADFGCGDAKIAKALAGGPAVHSFDLVSINEYVTACDMADIPLAPSTVDVAVFCLSLMGTNVSEFICEANRVLRNGGVLLVAEVVSRFEKVGQFVNKMAKLGFHLANKDISNKMFIWFEFHKTGSLPAVNRLPEIVLAPCVYKRR